MDPMEIVRETQALPMDKSKTPRNSPIPSTPLSPTPTSSAPPPIPPSNPTQLGIEPVSRQILQPVPPSKRAPPSNAHLSTEIETESAPQYIPQELAEIIAIRKRRERALHARFLICTSIISSIDSTLANLQTIYQKRKL